MRHSVAYLSALAVCFALLLRASAVPALKEREEAAAIKKATQDIQGSWYTVSITDKTTSTGEDKGDVITYEGNKFYQKRNGQIWRTGTFEIVDAKSDPMRIDYRVTDGNQPGLHYRAIFKVSGDSLIGCCDHGENNRPTEFSGDAGFYRVARRAKE
jgi:uncharacterized protein (TIGR03067 family)